MAFDAGLIVAGAVLAGALPNVERRDLCASWPTGVIFHGGRGITYDIQQATGGSAQRVRLTTKNGHGNVGITNANL